MVVIKEEAQDEWSPDVEQQDPKLLHMKEEEEHWTSLKREHLDVKETDSTSSSAEQIKAETSGEDCVGAETSRNLDLETYKDCSSASGTDGSEDDEDDNNLKIPDFLKPLSDSEPDTEDCNTGL
uniref:Uncharacterized protein n=1 Tax=Nothobranchius rachovii TaxID=451742 RepID=A0A1A8PF40_9TELE